MKRAAITGMVLCLLLAPGAAHAQEGRDHTHNPNGGTADPRALLRMVATLQASYSAEKGHFANTPQELRIPAMTRLRLHLAADGSEGYSAVAVSATEECVLYHGAVRSPRAFATQPDRVVCEPVARGTGAGGERRRP
jgi:hypothetical protein